MECVTKYKSPCPRCGEYVNLSFHYRVTGLTSPAETEMKFEQCSCSANEWDAGEKSFLENMAVEIATHTMQEDDELIGLDNW